MPTELQLFFDVEGLPIDVHKWAELFASWEYKCVADHTVGPYRICTIWLGADDDPPNRLIFETSVFGKDGDLSDLREHALYKTRTHALTGHLALVFKYKALRASQV